MATISAIGGIDAMKMIETPVSTSRVNLNLLKLMAMISMVIDHVHLIWFHRRGLGEAGIYSDILTKIGLLALPLFGFILTYNLLFHTSSKKKVLGRLVIS